ncbi:hypothetical protein DFJ73DRAFT_834734 [Zopfochytrium polystomum]|nr:hypothetical protein DFJ73DRAFT_834734 [Zopfochytrium polystomum]
MQIDASSIDFLPQASTALPLSPMWTSETPPQKDFASPATCHQPFHAGEFEVELQRAMFSNLCCSQCDAVLKDLYDLLNHLETHHSEHGVKFGAPSECDGDDTPDSASTSVASESDFIDLDIGTDTFWCASPRVAPSAKSFDLLSWHLLTFICVLAADCSATLAAHETMDIDALSLWKDIDIDSTHFLNNAPTFDGWQFRPAAKKFGVKRKRTEHPDRQESVEDDAFARESGLDCAAGAGTPTTALMLSPPASVLSDHDAIIDLIPFPSLPDSFLSTLEDGNNMRAARTLPRIEHKNPNISRAFPETLAERPGCLADANRPHGPNSSMDAFLEDLPEPSLDHLSVPTYSSGTPLLSTATLQGKSQHLTAESSVSTGSATPTNEARIQNNKRKRSKISKTTSTTIISPNTDSLSSSLPSDTNATEITDSRSAGGSLVSTAETYPEAPEPAKPVKRRKMADVKEKPGPKKKQRLAKKSKSKAGFDALANGGVSFDSVHGPAHEPANESDFQSLFQPIWQQSSDSGDSELNGSDRPAVDASACGYSHDSFLIPLSGDEQGLLSSISSASNLQPIDSIASVASAAASKPERATIPPAHRRYRLAMLSSLDPETGEKKFTCPSCSKEYRNANGLRYHLNHVHADGVGIPPELLIPGVAGGSSNASSAPTGAGAVHETQEVEDTAN